MLTDHQGLIPVQGLIPIQMPLQGILPIPIQIPIMRIVEGHTPGITAMEETDPHLLMEVIGLTEEALPMADKVLIMATLNVFIPEVTAMEDKEVTVVQTTEVVVDLMVAAVQIMAADIPALEEVQHIQVVDLVVVAVVQVEEALVAADIPAAAEVVDTDKLN